MASSRSLTLVVAASLMLAADASIHSETLTLSTTYPAPSGIYNQLVTTGDAGTAPANTTLARNAGNVILAPATNASGGVGVGTSSPQAKLDVNGLLKLGAFASDAAAADSAPEHAPAAGSLYYNTASGQFRGYQAGRWSALTGAESKGPQWVGYPFFLSTSPDQVCQSAGFSASLGACRANQWYANYQGMLMVSNSSYGRTVVSCFVLLGATQAWGAAFGYSLPPSQIACL